MSIVSVQSEELTAGDFVDDLDPKLASSPIGRYTIVRISVVNQSKNRKLDYIGYSRPGHMAVLSDNLGNRYKQEALTKPLSDQIGSQSLYPGTSLTDVMVFQPLVNSVKSITLTLPCDNFGEQGNLDLAMFADQIKDVPSAVAPSESP